MSNAAAGEISLAERAQAHIDAGELDAALSCFEQAMAAGRGPVDVAARIAESAMAAQRFDVAERYYSKVVRVVPDNAVVRLNHGYALHRLERYVEARDEAAAACELARDMSIAQTFLGRVSHTLNYYDEAVAAFERVTLLEPDAPRAWLNFGEALVASYTRFDEGAAALAKAATLGAEDQDFLIAVVSSQLGNGHFADAEAILKKIIREDPNARRSPMPNIWLGYVIRSQGREGEAASHYVDALAACQRIIANGDGAEAITYSAISAFILRAMGNTEMAGARMDELCRLELPPEAFVYDHDSYLPDTYERIQRLTRLVRGRDIALLLYGPSAHELEGRIDELRDLDICFASVNKFDEVENRFLAPIDRRLDLVIAGNPNDMRQRWHAFHDYLQRPDDNLLMLTKYAPIALPPPLGVGNAFADAFDSKLLYFQTGGPLPTSPVAPLSFLGGNTLSVSLPLLTLAGPKRIFIFGADGGAQAPGAHDAPAYFFGETAEVDASERRLREANRRFTNEARQCDHNAPFSVMAIAKLFRRPEPQVFNCCPHSNYRAFERISVDSGLRLLKDQSTAA